MPPAPQQQFPQPPQPERHLFVKFLAALFLGIPAVIVWLSMGTVVLVISAIDFDKEEEYCNVATVRVHGVMTASGSEVSELLGVGGIVGAEGIREQLLMAEEDAAIDAVLIDIDSPGGTPVAGDEVMRAIMSTEKPTVALVRDVGASAAYWAAAGADHIVASPISTVGSIGVTGSFTEVAGKNVEDGARWIDLSSGEYKDAGNPGNDLSENEEAWLQQQVDSIYEYMVTQIAEARPNLTRAQYLELADGRTYLGMDALRLGLIDTLGGAYEARRYLGETLNKLPDEIVLCEPYSGGWADLF